ncbi:mycofactocin-coupled SDR family oxidoreductase [Kitasatospora sp. NPDC004723]|uniref:mycofactocin-coupled SDR family oxidoreductase n=1 Tax=Kitasatospora sp. NPDC004723 TaxID=3154288 RepID=UPI0033AB4A32
MSRFTGKVVAITGAARGIGRSYALAFAAEGAHVVLSDIAAQIDSVPIPMGTSKDLEETRRAVEEIGAKCAVRTADVRVSAEVDGVVDTAVEEFGRLDVVCANAGLWSTSPLLDMTDEVWRDMIDTDLTGVFHTFRAAARVMVPQRGGRILVTGSVASRVGAANMTHYAAAKWGVLGLLKSAALELGPYGITVNAVSPSFTNTAMINNELNYRQFSPDDPTPQAAAAAWASLMPMRVPYIEPSEAADAALFLASDAARHISGVSLDVAAGWNAQYTA